MRFEFRSVLKFHIPDFQTRPDLLNVLWELETIFWNEKNSENSN